MSERPEPYLTESNPPRWSGWLWVLGFITLLSVGTEPQSRWDRVLLILVGLAFFVEGVDAVRTGRAEFRFSMWYGFEASRSDQPVRFWIYSMLNFALGGWVLAISILSAIPNAQTISMSATELPSLADTEFQILIAAIVLPGSYRWPN